MIGKSYDGTFANGVAATGVDGLTTIVPISAISDWYDYSRMGGIRENTHYPRSLDNSITATQPAATLGVLPPDHRTSCAKVFDDLNTVDGDDTGDINPFWNDRDYAKDGQQGQGRGLRVARHQRRQRPPGPDVPLVDRPGRQQRAAQAVAVARGSRRPVRVPPHRVGRHAAPLVRLLAAGRARTAS